MNSQDIANQPPLGFLIPPFALFRVPREYRGAPLAERLGRGKMLALTVANAWVEAGLVTCSKGEFSVAALKSFATAEWRIDPQAVAALKSETGARFLAVSYVRPPEQNQFFLCQNQIKLKDEENFHTTLAFHPKTIYSKAKDGCMYRGLPHPEASVSILAMFDPAWDLTCQKVAGATGLTLLRTELSILKLANVALADDRVRAGASLLIMDYSQALLVTSNASGVWEEPRLREIKGEQPAVADFVEKVVKTALREPHQRKVVLLDTRTSGSVDAGAALAALPDVRVEAFEAPGVEISQFHSLALSAA